MAFFKQFRDQLKANALINHLEFARDRFHPNDPSLALAHLGHALKALVAIKSARAERTLTFTGWNYVVLVSSQLGMILAIHHLADAMKDCDFIIEHAKKYKDEAQAIEFGHSH